MIRIDMAMENGDDQTAASKMELFANFSLPEPLNGEPLCKTWPCTTIATILSITLHSGTLRLMYGSTWKTCLERLRRTSMFCTTHLLIYTACAPTIGSQNFAHKAVMGLTDEYSSLWHSVIQTGAVPVDPPVPMEKALMSWSNLIQMAGFNYSSGDDSPHGYGSTNMQGRTLSVKMAIESAVNRARADSAALPRKAKSQALLLYLFRSTNDLDRFEKLMNACWEYWTDRSSDGAERRDSAVDPELLAILAASREQISSLRHDFVRCSYLTCLATPQLVPGTALSRNVGEPSMMSCPCHAVQYCSKACQRAHWKRHKGVCEHRKSSEKRLIPMDKCFLASTLHYRLGR